MLASGKTESNEGAALLRTLLILTAGALLATLPGWIGSAQAKHAPSRIASATHVGQRLSDFVTLSLRDSHTDSPFFARDNPDGSLETTEFQAPDGMAFVITDIDWAGQIPGVTDFAVMRLFVEDRADSDQRALAFASTKAVGDGGSSVQAGGNDAPTTGIIVPASVRLVADVAPLRQIGQSAIRRFSTNRGETAILLRGYLTRDD